MRPFLALSAALWLTIGATALHAAPSQAEADAQVKRYWDLPPFGADAASLANAWHHSCGVWSKRPASQTLHRTNPKFGTVGQWQALCTASKALPASQLEAFLLKSLTTLPMQPKHKPGYNVKFTGYYKPVLAASRTRTGAYQTPLLARPKNLTRCPTKLESGGFTTGQKQPDGSCTAPYPTRAMIENNLSAYQVIAWLADPVASYFLHIQGSGLLALPGGKVMHVGFAGKNGHPYVAIGKVMREQGLLSGSITADKIHRWLTANPARQAEIFHSNPSYIFFKETKTEAPGAMGVPVTAGRSLAVDRDHLPMGIPLIVSTTLSHTNEPWQRIMFAQDVGSAIQGPVRGDIYFGHGPLAGEAAGDQNAPGTLTALIPKS